jgi:hypothetical protein
LDDLARDFTEERSEDALTIRIGFTMTFLTAGNLFDFFKRERTVFAVFSPSPFVS